VDNLLVLALVVAAIAVVFFVAVRLPRRRADLDRAGLSESFHGLILFGKYGAYVRLDESSIGNRIAFTKRSGGDGGWLLEVAVSGPGASETLVERVESGLKVVGSQFTLASQHAADGEEVGFWLEGAGLKDPAALEGVARLVVRSLGHPDSTKYRVEFEGPKDYEAVNRYFGFKR